MIEMRWVYHDLSKSFPPAGAIYISGDAFQKLQYRYAKMGTKEDGTVEFWSEWRDVEPPSVSV